MHDSTRFLIRAATLNDRPAANYIHRLCLPDDKVYGYANNIGLNGTVNLVASVENQTVGFVSALINSPNPNGSCLWERMRPYIGFLGVVGEWRKSGIGRALTIESSRLAILATASDRIYLECEESNIGAQSFYEKLGFEKVEYDQ